MACGILRRFPRYGFSKRLPARRLHALAAWCRRTLAFDLPIVQPEDNLRRLVMAHFERIRDVISGPFSPEVMRQRTAAGGQLVSLECRRELPDSESPTIGAFAEDIPYGLRISDDCQRLEIDPTENRVLMTMMEFLVHELSYSVLRRD